ncbi:hypothetical protein APHAL10511_005439 [Amanita phalloides]|nr:hypothetical protein APHAL10511_005439 [Amanita phalloides]
MPGTSLPPLVPQRVQDRAAVVSAYNMLQRLENTILAENNRASVVTRGKNKRDVDLMYCRIIGHFFHHVPSDRGLVNLVREVTSTSGDRQKLLDLGKLYYDHAFRLFRSAKGRTPLQSRHPSRPSFNTMLEEAPTGHETAKRKALVRDGFRCVISGRYDRESVRRFRVLNETPGIELVATECAHILSESTNVATGEGSGKVYTDYAASAWAVLSRFSSRENLLKELNGPKVHHLENVMTMCLEAHRLFDKLEIWLEPTDVENVYNLGARYPQDIIGYQQVITFSTDNPKLPVPSREYLALHAACAKVAHLSAAAEYMDSVIREMEETLVLSSDGASVAVLEHALWTAQHELDPVKQVLALDAWSTTLIFEHCCTSSCLPRFLVEFSVQE